MSTLAGEDHDDLVESNGQSVNEKTLVAMMLVAGWRVSHAEHTEQRFGFFDQMGFAGKNYPVPILRDYDRNLDAVFRFPLRSGTRVFVGPVVLISEHGVLFAVSVDDDSSPESEERDRVLAAAGWGVYRFSDRQMRQDPMRVLYELQARLWSEDWVAVDPTDESHREQADEWFRNDMNGYEYEQ